jgi:hypothetical protein
MVTLHLFVLATLVPHSRAVGKQQGISVPTPTDRKGRTVRRGRCADVRRRASPRAHSLVRPWPRRIPPRERTTRGAARAYRRTNRPGRRRSLNATLPCGVPVWVVMLSRRDS